jgi:hypothetical protein
MPNGRNCGAALLSMKYWKHRSREHDIGAIAYGTSKADRVC